MGHACDTAAARRDGNLNASAAPVRQPPFPDSPRTDSAYAGNHCDWRGWITTGEQGISESRPLGLSST